MNGKPRPREERMWPKAFQMLRQGEKIVVGLSGGADSSALLHYLWSVKEELDLKLYPCHINHNLRGEEAVRDERFCREFCRSLGLELTVFSVDVRGFSKERKLSEEEGARILRYQRLEELAQRHDARIATAHTASDNVETILFHLIRGTGPRGLTGIPPERGRIFRPLLSYGRREIEAYCQKQGISYVTDSTNLTDAYSRNRIRHQIVPEMERINPALTESLGRLSELLQEQTEYLQAEGRKLLEICRTEKGEYSCRPFCSQLEVLQKQALLELFREKGLPYDYRRIQLAMERIQQGSGGVEICRGVWLQVFEQGQTFSLREETSVPAVPPFCCMFSLEEAACPEGLSFSLPTGEADPKTRFLTVQVLDCEQTKNFQEKGIHDLKNFLDYGKIYGIVKLRQRQPGDRYAPAGRQGSRSLKKLCNDKKVPLRERERMAVLEDERGILWVEGFGCDKRVAPDDTTSQLLKLEFLQR